MLMRAPLPTRHNIPSAISSRALQMLLQVKEGDIQTNKNSDVFLKPQGCIMINEFSQKIPKLFGHSLSHQT
ncbi:UDP-N-acetylmuramate--L-alanine ligase [Gossypium arboreum]|uniref:UDP-N-acetylmuramate--L-alanine ligase n=1 Tax=Gossypium arboreum TaxID=29729 RepID=A0A0B0PBD5_GOSAR|nr:UDP-N-acetylmuramate--L-alanine ligase [Gossypium arboreum]